jgi:hypothetical protein
MKERIEKVEHILNQGIKSQLMRGNRTTQQCWSITLDCIDRAIAELKLMKESKLIVEVEGLELNPVSIIDTIEHIIKLWNNNKIKGIIVNEDAINIQLNQ